ncbi:MAG: hypothetical protein R2824_12965 [Saprospiraceae bacterium]|nr:hypothetical protein [Lewinella sp.]
MKSALLNTFLILVLPAMLTAQYEKGTIRLASGELLSGYIATDTEVELKNRIHFKQSLGKSDFETYSPNELTGFVFDKGAAFESIETSFIRESILFKEKAFVKLVAEGTINLYLSQLTVDEDEFVFYARKDGRVHRISQNKEDPTQNYILKNYYQGVLNALTFDCRNRIGDVQRLHFSRRSIVELIDSYNYCQDPAYQPLANSYHVAKEKRYFVEFFSGPLIARRDLGSSFGSERIIGKETFAMVGLAAQVEIYKPALSKKLLVHNSLEAYKWVSLEASGILDPPVLSMVANIAAHYMFDESAKVKFFTRIGGAFVVDIGRQVLPRPGFSVGFGTYFPSGGRVSFQLTSLSLLGSEGLTGWRFGYAIPLGVEYK